MGDSQCVIIADVGIEPHGETQPHYTMPKDVAIAETPLRPLLYDCKTPPQQIRIFNRGRGYWLVTYIRKLDDRDRLFWGAIDWTAERVTLKELSTIATFEEAKQITGFI